MSKKALITGITGQDVLSLQSFCWEKGMRYTALPAVLLWQTLEESTICWRNMQ